MVDLEEVIQSQLYGHYHQSHHRIWGITKSVYPACLL